MPFTENGSLWQKKSGVLEKAINQKGLVSISLPQWLIFPKILGN
jgi:hypothetical protein